MPSRKPLLVTHFRVGDLIVRRKPTERYLVVAITPGSSLWAKETGLSVGDRVVWLQGDFAWSWSQDHYCFGTCIWSWWATSWAKRQRFPVVFGRQKMPYLAARAMHDDHEFYDLPHEDDIGPSHRLTAPVHAEWLHYYVRRGQAEYVCRQGDYEPDELLNQQAEREFRKVKGQDGSLPPLDPHLQKRKLKQSRAGAA
jgi:hypothetical protein